MSTSLVPSEKFLFPDNSNMFAIVSNKSSAILCIRRRIDIPGGCFFPNHISRNECAYAAINILGEGSTLVVDRHRVAVMSPSDQNNCGNWVSAFSLNLIVGPELQHHFNINVSLRNVPDVCYFVITQGKKKW